MKDLSFGELRAVNETRVKRWHGDQGVFDWSVMEWACAMTGEAGEAANVAKKIKRLDTGMARKNYDREKLVQALGDEIADTIIYLDLLAMREGIDVAEAVRRKYNQSSELYSFPERL